MPTPPAHPEWLTIPSDATLKKYGLDKQDYLAIVERQGYKCPICGNELRKRVNIDHFHVEGWKDMPPNLRRLYVRGCLCWFDNFYAMFKGITIEKARNIVKYLEDFEKRKPK